MELVIILAVLAAVDLAVVTFGADSRDGRDWADRSELERRRA
jgi:hypothetical protein